MKKSKILPLITLILSVLFIIVAGVRYTIDTDIAFSSPTEVDTSNAYRICINTASAPELDELPFIGPALAERIILYREENGPFRTIDELLSVKGIGKSIFNSIKDYISVV